MSEKREARWRMRCYCCGDRFEAVRQTATFCSPKCRQIASRKARGKRISGEWMYFRPEFREPPLLLVKEAVSARREETLAPGDSAR